MVPKNGLRGLFRLYSSWSLANVNTGFYRAPDFTFSTPVLPHRNDPPSTLRHLRKFPLQPELAVQEHVLSIFLLCRTAVITVLNELSVDGGA